MSTILTVNLEDDTKDRLEKLAAATQRSESFLVTEAIREYVELNEWQVGEIRASIGEADRGDFAAAAEVADFFDGWRRRAG